MHKTLFKVSALVIIINCFNFVHGISPGGGPFDETEEIQIPGGSIFFNNYVSFCELAKKEERKCKVAMDLAKSHLSKLPNDKDPQSQRADGAHTWKIRYNLKGNLQEENTRSKSTNNREERIVSFSHLPNTLYIKSFDMISEELDDILIHHLAIIFCKDLGEGYTVSEDRLIDEDGNERKACKGLIAPYGEAWGIPLHLNTSKSARGFQLPNDVGLMVGTQSNYKFVGVSIHYTAKGPVVKNAIKKSGILMTVSNKAPKYYMGMIYSNTFYNIPNNELASVIPGGQKEYTIGTSCIPTISETLKVFSYAIHTHTHGTSASIYIHSPSTNTTRQILLDNNPSQDNKLESFREEIVLRPGEVVVSTCTFDTSKTGDIKLGGTAKTEMCDFLLNYYRSSGDKDEHIIKCSDNVISDSAQWNQILRAKSKGSLVYH